MKRSIFTTSYTFFGLLTFLLSGLLCCFAFPSQAQGHHRASASCHKFAQTHLRLGTSVHGIGGPATPHLGTTLGLVQEFHLLPWVQLRVEGNLLWQGQANNFWVADGDVDYFSINAPLMLQLKLSKRFYVAGGLALSYLAHAQGGPLPSNRLGINRTGLVHYRFYCNRVGLELRWQQRSKNTNLPIDRDANGKVIAPFDDTSLQIALTVRL